MAGETPKRVTRRPKSYRGCKACKNARKKCSEVKPECAFCIRNGLKCEYDMDVILRFETFVDGKQPPRRKLSNKDKAESVRPEKKGRHLGQEGLEHKESIIDFSSIDNHESPIDSDETTVLESCQIVSLPLNQPAYFPLNIDPGETHYLTFFLTEVKSVMPYFECFPQMVNEIFNRATTEQALLQTILSVSHLIADSRLGRSLIPAFHHQQQALSALQRSISAVDITEGLAISVTMLAWLNICQANRTALFQHLHGAYLIFQDIQKRHVSGKVPSPLLMQIWRVALRLDLLAAILFFPRKPLFPPVPTGEDDLHRHWIRLSTPTEQTAEWTLASFAIDNLMHRACHIAHLSHTLRQTSTRAHAQHQIEKWTSELLKEHNEWYQREIVQYAEQYERELNKTDYTPIISKSQFLDNPPLRLYNKFYGNMINCWRAIYIYIDLIVSPHIGPGSKDSPRFQRALDICRTYASLGTGAEVFPSGKIWSMFLAGVALGGVRRSPKETYWMYKSALAEMKEVFPLNVGVLGEFVKLWEVEGDYWDTLEKLNEGLARHATMAGA